MRLYISCDMEGTAGVCSWMQVDPSNAHEYPRFRGYMTREVRAAIDGARATGEHQILINDSHWNQCNLLLDELPDDVRVISGAPKPLSMTQGAQAGFDAAFFTGYHGAAGSENAALSHTYNVETLYRVRVNGTLCSEALLNAALLGTYDTPVVLVTGDRASVEDTLTHLPWARGVVVKESIGYNAVNSLTPQGACEAIRTGARDAMTRVAGATPFRFTPPIEMIIETVRVENADFIELLPGFERIDGRTLCYRNDDYRRVFRAFLVAMRLGGAANAVA